jgi:hypothetical protein
MGNFRVALFIYHAAFFLFRALAQRAATALRAFAILCSFVNFAADAFPPIECVFGLLNGMKFCYTLRTNT